MQKIEELLSKASRMRFTKGYIVIIDDNRLLAKIYKIFPKYMRGYTRLEFVNLKSADEKLIKYLISGKYMIFVYGDDIKNIVDCEKYNVVSISKLEELLDSIEVKKEVKKEQNSDILDEYVKSNYKKMVYDTESKPIRIIDWNDNTIFRVEDRDLPNELNMNVNVNVNEITPVNILNQENIVTNDSTLYDNFINFIDDSEPDIFEF